MGSFAVMQPGASTLSPLHPCIKKYSVYALLKCYSHLGGEMHFVNDKGLAPSLASSHSDGSRCEQLKDERTGLRKNYFHFLVVQW